MNESILHVHKQEKYMAQKNIHLLVDVHICKKNPIFGSLSGQFTSSLSPFFFRKDGREGGCMPVSEGSG